MIDTVYADDEAFLPNTPVQAKYQQTMLAFNSIWTQIKQRSLGSNKKEPSPLKLQASEISLIRSHTLTAVSHSILSIAENLKMKGTSSKRLLDMDPSLLVNQKGLT